MGVTYVKQYRRGLISVKLKNLSIMTQFKVGQTVSVPRLQHYGKGFIYMIDPKNASGYTHYIQFKDKVGKLVLPPDLLKAEEIPVKTAKRWVDFNDEDSGEETFIPDDTPSLDMDLHY